MDRNPFEAFEGCTTDEVPVFMLSELQDGNLEPDADALLEAYSEVTGELSRPDSDNSSDSFSSSKQLETLLLDGSIKPKQAKAMVQRVRTKREFGEDELELTPFAEEILAELDRGDIGFEEASELIRAHNSGREVMSVLEEIPEKSAIVCIGRQAHRRLMNVQITGSGSISMGEQIMKRRRRGF